MKQAPLQHFPASRRAIASKAGEPSTWLQASVRACHLPDMPSSSQSPRPPELGTTPYLETALLKSVRLGRGHGVSQSQSGPWERKAPREIRLGGCPVASEAEVGVTRLHTRGHQGLPAVSTRCRGTWEGAPSEPQKGSPLRAPRSWPLASRAVVLPQHPLDTGPWSSATAGPGQVLLSAPVCRLSRAEPRCRTSMQVGPAAQPGPARG